MQKERKHVSKSVEYTILVAFLFVGLLALVTVLHHTDKIRLAPYQVADGTTPGSTSEKSTDGSAGGGSCAWSQSQNIERGPFYHTWTIYYDQDMRLILDCSEKCGAGTSTGDQPWNRETQTALESCERRLSQTYPVEIICAPECHSFEDISPCQITRTTTGYRDDSACECSSTISVRGSVTWGCTPNPIH